MIFEGAISCKAILNNNNRVINTLYIREGKNDRNSRYIIRLAEKRNIEVKYLDKEEIDNLASGFTHGGILLDAEGRNFSTVNEILEKKNFIVVIDGIEDPYNLGYAMRSLYAFGANAFLISNRRLSESESSILKSSAGAYEELKIAKSDDLIRDLNYLKTQGIELYALQRCAESTALEDIDFSDNMAFIVGGEKRGISKDVLKEVDKMVYIAYDNDFRNALNASSAITCIGFMKYLHKKM